MPDGRPIFVTARYISVQRVTAAYRHVAVEHDAVGELFRF